MRRELLPPRSFGGFVVQCGAVLLVAATATAPRAQDGPVHYAPAIKDSQLQRGPFPDRTIQPVGATSASSSAASSIQLQPGTMLKQGQGRTEQHVRTSAGPAKPIPAAPMVSTGGAVSAALEEPLRAWPGESVAEIRAAYPGAPEPAPYHSADPADTQDLWLRERGVRFFLAPNGTINVVRLDRPFRGSVDGVHLGNRIEDVRLTLGSPGKDLGDKQHYLFATNPKHRMRVELDGDQRVRSILLFR